MRPASRPDPRPVGSGRFGPLTRSLEGLLSRYRRSSRIPSRTLLASMRFAPFIEARLTIGVAASRAGNDPRTNDAGPGGLPA
jgi:hypothetical protein